MSLNLIIERYQQLSEWCEKFWTSVYTSNKSQFACCKGCSTCCELQTVNILEAYVIWAGIKKSNNEFSAKKDDSRCPFLVDEVCSIYINRPIICRTHGLVFKSKEFDRGIALSCPFNFEHGDFETLPQSQILDIDTITENLIKLNLAFSMIMNRKDLSEVRIPLIEIAYGKIDELFSAL